MSSWSTCPCRSRLVSVAFLSSVSRGSSSFTRSAFSCSFFLSLSTLAFNLIANSSGTYYSIVPLEFGCSLGWFGTWNYYSDSCCSLNYSSNSIIVRSSCCFSYVHASKSCCLSSFNAATASLASFPFSFLVLYLNFNFSISYSFWSSSLMAEFARDLCSVCRFPNCFTSLLFSPRSFATVSLSRFCS